MTDKEFELQHDLGQARERIASYTKTIGEQSAEITRLRAAVGRYLAENDPVGFGCACEPNHICGPCSSHKRQQVLRDALGSNAELRGATRLYRGASRLSDGLAGKT